MKKIALFLSILFLASSVFSQGLIPLKNINGDTLVIDISDIQMAFISGANTRIVMAGRSGDLTVIDDLDHIDTSSCNSFLDVSSQPNGSRILVNKTSVLSIKKDGDGAFITLKGGGIIKTTTLWASVIADADTPIGCGGSGGGGATNLSTGTRTSTTFPINNSNGTGVTIDNATIEGGTNVAGLMTPIEKGQMTQQIIAYSATISANLNNGNRIYVDMTGDAAIAAPSNSVAGEEITYILTANGANRTATFASVVFKEEDGVTDVGAEVITSGSTKAFTFKVGPTVLHRIGGGSGSGDDVSAFTDGTTITPSEKLVSPDSLYTFAQLVTFLKDSIGVASVSYNGSTLTITRKDGSTVSTALANVVSGAGAPVGAPGTGQRWYIDVTNDVMYFADGVNWVLFDADNVPITDAGRYFAGTNVEAALQEVGATAFQNFANTNLSANNDITHTGNTGGVYRDLTFNNWGKWTSLFTDTSSVNPTAYDFQGISAGSGASIIDVIGVRVRTNIVGANLNHTGVGLAITPSFSGTLSASGNKLMLARPFGQAYDNFNIAYAGSTTTGTLQATSSGASRFLISTTSSAQTLSAISGTMNLQSGFNTMLQVGSTGSTIATISGTPSGVATQKDSRLFIFQNNLWDGSAPTTGTFTLYSKASTSISEGANLILYTSSSGASGDLININRLTGKVTISRPSGSKVTSTNELLELVGTSSFLPPRGTTAQRPLSPTSGAERYNSTTGLPEWFDGTNWNSYGVSGSSIQTASSGATTAIAAAPTKVDIKVIVAQVTGASTIINLPALASIPSGKEVTVKFQGIDPTFSATIGVSGGGVNIDNGTTVTVTDAQDYSSFTFWHNGTQYFIK